MTADDIILRTVVTEKTYDESSAVMTFPSNGSVTYSKRLYQSTSRTMTITKINGSTETLSNVKEFGYTANIVTGTKVTNGSSTTLDNAIYFDTYKYYATYNSELGAYQIVSATYTYVDYTSMTTHNIQKTERVSVREFYYGVPGGFLNLGTNTYSFLDKYPTAVSVSIGNYTFDLVNDEEFRYTVTFVDEVDTSTDVDPNGAIINVLRETNTYLDAMAITSNVVANIENVVNNYWDVSQATYALVTPSSNSYSITAGVYLVGLSSSGGFTYTDASGIEDDLKSGYAMEQILSQANANINTAKYGLYYHQYYAYVGDTVTVKGHTYTHNNVYYLDEVNGEFVFRQSDNANARTFTELTGTWSSVTNEVAKLKSTDVGKIYYYTGDSDEGMTQGTNVWYQVLKNSETGAYEFIKFGVLSSKFDEVNHSSGEYSQKTPSLNTNGLNVLCNIVRYNDDSDNSSTFTYGVGGERVAIVKAIITVGGVDYTRYFLVNVIG